MNRVEDLQWLYNTLDIGGKTPEFYEAQKSIILDALVLLEKQIPRELTNIRKVKQYDGYDMGNCPVCGEPIDNSFHKNLKYCFVCGQAIKWE